MFTSTKQKHMVIVRVWYSMLQWPVWDKTDCLSYIEAPNFEKFNELLDSMSDTNTVNIETVWGAASHVLQGKITSNITSKGKLE